MHHGREDGRRQHADGASQEKRTDRSRRAPQAPASPCACSSVACSFTGQPALCAETNTASDWTSRKPATVWCGSFTTATSGEPPSRHSECWRSDGPPSARNGSAATPRLYLSTTSTAALTAETQTHDDVVHHHLGASRGGARSSQDDEDDEYDDVIERDGVSLPHCVNVRTIYFAHTRVTRGTPRGTTALTPVISSNWTTCTGCLGVHDGSQKGTTRAKHFAKNEGENHAPKSRVVAPYHAR